MYEKLSIARQKAIGRSTHFYLGKGARLPRLGPGVFPILSFFGRLGINKEEGWADFHQPLVHQVSGEGCMYRQSYQKKLATPEKAVAAIADAATIVHGMATGKPPALLGVIADRVWANPLQRTVKAC